MLSHLKQRITIISFLALIVLLLISIKTVPTSSNESSRFLTIEALVNNGTFAITNPITDGDLTFTGKYYYSDKPPLLSLVAAGFYAILRWLHPRAPSLLTLSPQISYIYLTLVISAFPYLLLIYLFWRSLSELRLKSYERLLYTLALALGTPLLPFATVFSNHAITALIAFASFYFIVVQKITKKTIIVVGVLVGLLPAIDVPFGTAWFVIITALLWPDIRKYFWHYSLAVIPGIILTLTLNWLTTGSALPMYLVAKQYLSLPENNWRTDLTLQAPLQIMVNITQAFTGWKKGIFIYTPILLLSFWATVRNTHSLFNRCQRSILFWGSLTYIIGVIIITNDLGGNSYGLRWALPFMPIWLWVAAEFWPTIRTKQRYVWVFLGGFSLLMAFRGLPDPWQSGFDTSLWRVVIAYFSTF